MQGTQGASSCHTARSLELLLGPSGLSHVAAHTSQQRCPHKSFAGMIHTRVDLFCEKHRTRRGYWSKSTSYNFWPLLGSMSTCPVVLSSPEDPIVVKRSFFFHRPLVDTKCKLEPRSAVQAPGKDWPELWGKDSILKAGRPWLPVPDASLRPRPRPFPLSGDGQGHGSGQPGPSSLSGGAG